MRQSAMRRGCIAAPPTNRLFGAIVALIGRLPDPAKAVGLIAALVGSAAPLTGSSASAASLQVSPTTVDMLDQAVSSIDLVALGTEKVPAQIRVFRWTQVDGKERLIPTTELAASPPSATVSPGARYTVRIVGQPGAVTDERAYRLIVDELPDPAKARNGAVTFALRYAIPVFLRSSSAQASKLAWSARVVQGELEVRVVNSGGRRERIVGLKAEASGQSINFGDGLVGYALAGGEMSWRRPLPKALSGSSLRLSGTLESGPLDARIPLGR
jgi:fimbrial chaperone protein